MSINWLILAPADEDLRIPTYGKYGGPDYSGGRLLREGETPSFTIKPIDPLDRLFRQHDMEILEAESSLDQAKVDLRLIKGILKLSDDAVSGEGDLYAGAAILAMIGRIIVTDRHPEVLAAINLPKTIDKAVSLIEQGSIRPDAREIAGFQEWLHEASAELASRNEPIFDLAADKLRDLADSLQGPNAETFRFNLDGDAFTFSVGEAKALLAEAVLITAEAWDSDHPGGPALTHHDADQVALPHQIEALAQKMGLHSDFGHFLF
jgi:hypothetical protein